MVQLFLVAESKEQQSGIINEKCYFCAQKYSITETCKRKLNKKLRFFFFLIFNLVISVRKPLWLLTPGCKNLAVSQSVVTVVNWFPNIYGFLWFCLEDVHSILLSWFTSQSMWCGRKVMRLAMLCMNRQRCCLPLHMAFRLAPAVDSVQVWTCYSCCVIVERASEVVFVRCITKTDRQKFEQRCAINFV